ncbi:phenylalanine--tRNA ligase subunit alpha [Pacificimonas flava]|uniref:Phenylalanine--tRNA ligase alpha subunit n=2 Tax=Pacificimonas TaxID=1960290 RepID=A0A219B3S3_9SPHN|nr:MULTISPECIES: phenylalanine--tRNA ligase subunit alpha [Pacificimonas]MBZ6377279.1 phenylalanine--tRNA ligase subunit alpha [Pacificimonas aurantium]OWV33010.1 phenylalanine--tRNA ligase subunit alpha [Pacificimonas flava]
MTADIDQQTADWLARIAAADSPSDVEALRVEALGKSGAITAQLKTLGKMSPEERQTTGAALNRMRQEVQAALTSRKEALEAAELDRKLTEEAVDVSLPVDHGRTGSVHPVSQVMDELAEIFADLGFAVATGPEIEDDWHNFTALNIPEHHPARTMHDTFWFPKEEGEDAPKLLRTHTSPVQIRTMTDGEPPIRIIAPGRVYRSDSDATHTPMFHQVEGLVIDRGIHMGHLKWTLETFVKAFFETDDVELRLRPSYFPFTEPSAEVDVRCSFAGGKLTITSDGDDWMEILGSGMVNRRVIEMCGLDPSVWQGFAFGVGIDRLAMLKYGMTDLRQFFEGDLRWSGHYGFSPFAVPTLSQGVGA